MTWERARGTPPGRRASSTPPSAPAATPRPARACRGSSRHPAGLSQARTHPGGGQLDEGWSSLRSRKGRRRARPWVREAAVGVLRGVDHGSPRTFMLVDDDQQPLLLLEGADQVVVHQVLVAVDGLHPGDPSTGDGRSGAGPDVGAPARPGAWLGTSRPVVADVFEAGQGKGTEAPRILIFSLMISRISGAVRRRGCCGAPGPAAPTPDGPGTTPRPCSGR